jgi:mannose-6-phosphate isomerase-like protein (cupin superfamily)
MSVATVFQMVHHTVNHLEAPMASNAKRKPIHLQPGAGRSYPMGPLTAVFKADGDEAAGRYSISEWWLEPHTKGPGAHSHEEDDVFFVLEGTVSFFIGDRWVDAEKGSFIVAPGGVHHDFENRSNARAGFLNISAPGDFEENMPGIAEWFRNRSPSEARTDT